MQVSPFLSEGAPSSESEQAAMFNERAAVRQRNVIFFIIGPEEICWMSYNWREMEV